MGIVKLKHGKITVMKCEIVRLHRAAECEGRMDFFGILTMIGGLALFGKHQKYYAKRRQHRRKRRRLQQAHKKIAAFNP